MTGTAVERYLELGLQLGRHDEGVVDAYFGPPELRAAVEAAPPVEPRRLVAAAETLLDDLDDGWLRDQVVGLRTFAAGLAGEDLAYADEVEGCFGVRPTYTDESEFVDAHERLDELLPGAGPLAERLERWLGTIRVPADQIETVVRAVVAEARRSTLDLVELPDSEGADLELVRDVPWLAYNDYRGDFRGLISVNVQLPISALELLHVALHEGYPGHQAERACKEKLLVRERGLLEETLVLAPTQQSLVSEGIAEVAPHLLLDSESGAAIAAVVRDAGIDFDLAQALAIDRAHQPCRWAEVNAALMLHESGASQAEVARYLERWGPLSPRLAAQVVRFIADPASRTYVVNYPAGHALCRAYVAGDPKRFAHLLTEQVRVSDLLAATTE